MLRRRFHRLLGLAALAVCAGLALPTAAQAADAGKLSVVATTGMLADTVREIGGDRVEVTALMGVGVDPHTYRQTRSDVAKLTRAQLIVWHGLHLEAQLEDLFKDLARRKPVLQAQHGVLQQMPRGNARQHRQADRQQTERP